MSKIDNKPSAKESIRILLTERKHLLYMIFLTGFFIGMMVAADKQCKQNELKKEQEPCCHCKQSK